MKKVLFMLMMFLMTVPAKADVVYEVIDTQVYEDKIIIYVEFRVDGIVQSKNYKHAGKNVEKFVYSALDFEGLTANQAKQKLNQPVKSKAEYYLIKKFLQSENTSVVENKLSNLIGTKVTVETADLPVDSDNDGVLDQIWTVKTDGTKTLN